MSSIMLNSLAEKMHKIGKLQDELIKISFTMFGIHRVNNHLRQVFIEFTSKEVVIKVHGGTHSYLYTDGDWDIDVLDCVNKHLNRRITSKRS